MHILLLIQTVVAAEIEAILKFKYFELFSLQSNKFKVEVAVTVHGGFKYRADSWSQTLSSWHLI